MPDLKISHNKRISFIGKTRTGKTFLSNYLLSHFQNRKDMQIILLDPKHERRNFGDGSTLELPKLVKEYKKNIKVQCFQEYHWNAELDNMVDHLLKRGNAIVDLDELGGIATASQVPDGITRLATQGGGKGVGLWSKYQKPLGVPRVIKSQSEYFFMFRINPLDDRKEMLNYIPDERILTKIPKYFFWIYQDDFDTAILCKPLELKKK
jgi:hypothetical protein